MSSDTVPGEARSLENAAMVDREGPRVFVSHRREEGLLNRDIAERLWITREALGYTQSFVARELGIGANTWNQYEKAARVGNGPRIPIPILVRAVLVLQCSTDWILRGNTAGLSNELIVKLDKARRNRR